MVVNNLSGSLTFELIVEQDCESMLLKAETWLLRFTFNSGWKVEISLQSVENFVNSFATFLLSVRGFTFRKMKVSKALIWFVWDYEAVDKTVSLTHKWTKDSLFVLLPEQTLLDSPLLVRCLFFFALLFWRYFPVFLDTSVSTKSENFASFDHANPKSFSRYFSFSATAIVWLHILQDLNFVQSVWHAKLPFLFSLMCVAR